MANDNDNLPIKPVFDRKDSVRGIPPGVNIELGYDGKPPKTVVVKQQPVTPPPPPPTKEGK